MRKKYGNASFRRRAVFVYCVTCQIYLIVPIYTGTAIINSKIIEQTVLILKPLKAVNSLQRHKYMLIPPLTPQVAGFTKNY